MQTVNPDPIDPLLFDDEPADRIPHGADERQPLHDAANCPDCAVREGKVHVLGCESELCPNCGGLLAECPCAFSFES